MTGASQRKSTGFFDFLSLFGKGGQQRADVARLEAFLSAVPGEYCGWASDRSIAYSHGFCQALGLQTIQSLGDLEAVLSLEDYNSLQHLFTRLVQDGIAFTINVQNAAENKTFKISGTRGVDIEGSDHFHILWLEDITELKSASEVLQEEQDLMRGEFDKLQEALDCLDHPVWVRDDAQKITWCNVSYAKMVNASPSEIIAEQREIVATDKKRKPSEKDMLFGADLARKAMESGQRQELRTHNVIGGKRLLLEIVEIPVKAKGISIGVAQDLTGQEEILDQVENNQRANRALLEELRSAIAIFDADQKLEFYNSSFSQLWGLEDGWLNTSPKLGDIMEKLRAERRLPEQADFRSFKQSWLDMFTGLIDASDDMLHLPDGSALRMLVVPHKLGGLMMTFEDVTSRLELESSYNTLIAVQKETLDNLAEAVAVYGGDGRLKLWNPSFGRLWKLDPESLNGGPHIARLTEKFSSYFAEDDWAEMKPYLISLALDRSMNDGRLERSDGSLVDFVTVPLPDGGVLVTYTDVSDTVRVENALREKNAALETAEKLKMDFLANVSYQLRTPLNAIMGFNEILEQEFFGSLNEKQKEYTRDIQGASERLLNLINDILDLSTIEAGQMDLEIAQVSVRDMMQSVQGLVFDWARKEDIGLTIKCPANIGKIAGDETRLKQALINLVRNSIGNSQAGTKIEITVKRQKDHVAFSVTDQGAGIAPEDQKRILKPFERIDGGHIGRGAGIGLSLVKNITSLHGGAFDLSSEIGSGTTVTLTVPREQTISAGEDSAA